MSVTSAEKQGTSKKPKIGFSSHPLKFKVACARPPNLQFQFQLEPRFQTSPLDPHRTEYLIETHFSKLSNSRTVDIITVYDDSGIEVYFLAMLKAEL